MSLITMSAKNGCLCTLLCLIGGGLAWAQNLGTAGPTYPADRDARLQLKKGIEEKYASGEMDRFWKKYAEQSVRAVRYPEPLPGITSNFAVSSHDYELKFQIPQNYTDEKGLVWARKGDWVEPLLHGTLSHQLYFIDGRDQRQVSSAVQLGRLTPIKIVLTAGSAYELRLQFRAYPWQGQTSIPFYFDQKKMIINQLGRLYGIQIHSVPALVTQRGSRLRITLGLAV
jgi:conjugal transfer pilus assembly protein TraW